MNVSYGKNNPRSTGLKIEEFDANEPVADYAFPELLGCLMWLANKKRPDIANAAPAVARYANKPKEVH